jgi:hypothetical protein
MDDIGLMFAEGGGGDTAVDLLRFGQIGDQQHLHRAGRGVTPEGGPGDGFGAGHGPGAGFGHHFKIAGGDGSF